MLASQQTLAPAVSLPRSRRSVASSKAAATRPRLDRQRAVAVRAQRQEESQAGLVETTAAVQSMGVPLLTVRAAALRCLSVASGEGALAKRGSSRDASQRHFARTSQATSVAFLLLADAASAAEATSSSQQVSHAELYQLASSVRATTCRAPSVASHSGGVLSVEQALHFLTPGDRKTGRFLAEHGALRPLRHELGAWHGVHHPETTLRPAQVRRSAVCLPSFVASTDSRRSWRRLSTHTYCSQRKSSHTNMTKALLHLRRKPTTAIPLIVGLYLSYQGLVRGRRNGLEIFLSCESNAHGSGSHTPAKCRYSRSTPCSA